MAGKTEVTRILHAIREGDEAAREQFAPLVYKELRRIAHGKLKGETPDRTLQTTDLVHEAWMRLDAADLDWSSRAHFLRVAANTMRRILVDHARARRADRRGGDRERIPLDALTDAYEKRANDLVGLDDALTRMSGFDPLKTHLIELRFFGGLTMAEASKVLDLPLSTAERHWSAARAWLAGNLASGG